MTNKIFTPHWLKFPFLRAPIMAHKFFLLHCFEMMQGYLISCFGGLCKKLDLRIWMGRKKNKNIFFDFFHSLRLGYRRFVTIDWLLVNGFFVRWILERVELNPKTRTLLISELLRQQCLDHSKGRAYSDGNKSDEQWPENYIGHCLSPNLKWTA